MSEIKKICIKVFALILDIILLGYKVIKQISLPNRKRKGNLLSSLFVFFIDIIERLNLFEHGFFSMAALLRKKYVKQIIFIIGFILFLLSLFEWTGDQKIISNAESTSAAQIATSSIKNIGIAETRQVKNASYEASLYNDYPAFYTFPHRYVQYSCPVRRFLLIRSLRI